MHRPTRERKETIMLVHSMSDADYHARSELSSTGARRILENPAKYKYWSMCPEKPKAAFDLGTAAHTKVLGTGTKTVIYPPEHLTPSGNVSTKAATVVWENEQRAKGLIPISESDNRRVDAMAESALKHPEARGLIESISGREVTILTNIEGVDVRARFDLYDGQNAADVKTARDASPKGFNKSVASYGYHIQERWYRDAHRAETGTELETFKFLVIESVAPYLVAVYDLDFMWEEIATKRTKQARDTYRECVNTGKWPGYVSGTLTPPTWAVYEDDDAEITV